MESTSAASFSQFICFYGYECWSQFKEGRMLVFYAAQLNDDNKRKRDSYDYDHVLQDSLYLKTIKPLDYSKVFTVSLGSNMYCFLSGDRRVLCPQIGWREIHSHMLIYRYNPYPLTAVADGNIYVIAACQQGPWAQVFNPCNETYPPPGGDYPCHANTQSFFCASMALDVDGLGFSRKVIVLAAYDAHYIHVYDVDAKSWVLPPTPKLYRSFFYTQFPTLKPACKPVLVDKIVYWYAMPQYLCTYNVENGECDACYFHDLELMVPEMPDNTENFISLVHLDGPRFCLIWSDLFLVFCFFKGSPNEVFGANAASISVEYVDQFFAGNCYFDSLATMIVNGKLEATKLPRVVGLLPPKLDDICIISDIPAIEIIPDLESECVPILQFQAKSRATNQSSFCRKVSGNSYVQAS